LIHKSAREREYLAELVQRTDRSTLLDQLPIGIAKLDQEYRYTYLNDQAIASLHIRPEELLGRSVWEVYPTVAGTFVEDAYRSAMEDRVVNSIELYFEPVETWFDVEAHPAEDGGIVVFFYNADQRKRSESDLSSLLESAERQRRYYTTILTTTPDFAYIWGADYKFLYANKALLDLYGLTEEEYVGHSFRDVGYPEWHARMHEQEMDEVIRTGKPLRGKVPFQAKGGSGIYDYIFMPVFGPDGKVEAIAGTTRDVTALERSAEALKEADKRKDEFLAVLAHELRNPLAPLRSGVELLREDTSPGVLQQAQDIMSRQIEHMVHLVDDLLDLSRVNRGAIELRKATIPLRKMLDLALETVRPLIQDRKHHLHLELGHSSLIVNGDITRLAQVFSNLLNNAAKYTEPGGDITVRVVKEDGVVNITVSDSGIGIEQQDLAKVFEMFAQVDRKSERAKGGLGIGLNIVQRLVQMHGGTISAASEGLGKGSDFTVTLPLEELQESSPRIVTEQTIAMKPLRILIVDDNVDAAFVLSMLLKRLGHEVHATHG
ncbi:MAG: PAS domain-containing protein, partial [Flavobacteriales bacterium]